MLELKLNMFILLIFIGENNKLKEKQFVIEL